jgi:uncharacterized protein (DUF305 family)
MRNSSRALAAMAAIAALLVALLVSACGGDDEQNASSETDGEFVAAMVPHHESAIEMAEIAQRRAEHREIEELAANIIESQSAEIERLETDYERLHDEPLAQTGMMGDGGGMLGMGENDAGMSMHPDELEDAKPFDLAFIDAMVPHHQGAIRMARVELARGEDSQLKLLAEEIIEAQSMEIERMNSWREEWYGSPSPAGGVPETDGDAMPSHGEMGH